MQTSEKKLGCLKGTMRANKPYIGYIGGSINDSTMPKGGRKQVSIIDKKVVFWIVKDFDVTVSPEDIVGCSVVDIGVPTGKLITAKYGEQTKKANEYGHAFLLTFSDGTTGKLEIKDFLAFNDIKVTPNMKEWASAYANPAYIPVVAGWLAPNGQKDGKYGDLVCPEGYTPDIVELRLKAESSNKISAIADIANAVQCKTPLSELSSALNLHTRFTGFNVVTGDNNRVYVTLTGSHISINNKPRAYIRIKK